MKAKTKKRPRRKVSILRERLDIIDGWLAKDDKDAAKLWDVLAALRGPDSNNSAVKKSTTVHIRRAAFPQTASDMVDNIAASFQTDLDFKRYVDNSGHFNGHIETAAKALGL